jgi:GNAT superfamily N-acetyltransferase
VIWPGGGLCEPVVRRCDPADLPALEWSAALHEERPVIAWAFARAQRGEMIMLVAQVGPWLVGQIWIDLARKPGIALLWALRVQPDWRGRGIGTSLIAAAEREAARVGWREAELAVVPGNARARALYERLGYFEVGREPAIHALTGAPLGFELELLRRRIA